jgi:NAD(P)-dependent dehydrogenase (short-subunit alcohol dehydrogenase family)
MNTNQPVAMITGASSGIGRALALELAARGERLALISRREEALESVAAQVESRGGVPLVLACDVRDPEQVAWAAAETGQRFGRIDLAILSAGIGGPTDAPNFAAAPFAQLVTTNLLGVAYFLEVLIPVMRQQGGGTIAALSSLAGDRGMPGSAGYCATKAALSTLCDGMRAQLQARGIRLVTVEPGYIRTPMTAHNGRMPFLMEVDEAARLILRRLDRGDRVIRFPLPASLFMRVMSLLPARLFDAAWAGRRPVRFEDQER